MNKITPLLFISMMIVFNISWSARAQEEHDAKRYCARAVNDDTIRRIPLALIKPILIAQGLIKNISENVDPDEIRQSQERIVYRCMNTAVFYCDRGANIPCDFRPDTRRNRREVNEYCRQEPNAEFVPMSVKGHSTIFSWRCVRGRPQIIREANLDSRGFNSEIWTPLD